MQSDRNVVRVGVRDDSTGAVKHPAGPKFPRIVIFREQMGPAIDGLAKTEGNTRYVCVNTRLGSWRQLQTAIRLVFCHIRQ